MNRKSELYMEWSERLSRMASALSHEIKNPLASIDIQLQLLQERLMAIVEDNESEKLLRYIRVISREIRRLENILDEFLSFSRRANLELRSCQLENEVQKLLDLITPDAHERKIDVDISFDKNIPPAICDPDKIRQVLLNLILNAFQAMPEGGQIVLKIEYNDFDEQISFSIKDTGAGIDQRYWDAIFEPFFTSKKSGTGLGLSIARNIVHDHGGDIRVLKSDTQGTVIQFRLPVTQKSRINVNKLADSIT